MASIIDITIGTANEQTSAPFDPVLPAIANHRVAYGKWIEAGQTAWDIEESGTLDGFVQARAAADTAAIKEDLAMRVLDVAGPETPAGVLAFRDYMLLCADRQDGVVNLKRAFARICDQLASTMR